MPRFEAAEDGLVHLVQRRNGPFDFSYLAIKAGPAVRPRVRVSRRHGLAQPWPLLRSLRGGR